MSRKTGYISIATFIPGIRQISTSANVMRDIERYIEISIADKTMCRKLTNDSCLIEEIKGVLLTKSNGMFLWVYLQLEILWDICHSDAEIRSALAALPETLEKTYGRCIARMNLQDSRVLKVIKWVSFASTPLHIEELREAVAFDIKDTVWNAEKTPQEDFVLGCCANLVVIDSLDRRVRFAHSSVQQYLEKNNERSTHETNIPGYPTLAQGDLECGEFCVAYLSFSDFNLQLTTRPSQEAAITVPPPLLLVPEVLGSRFARSFLRTRYDQKINIPVQFRRIRTDSTPDQTRYKFLDYAVRNWALQTRQISRASLLWKKFEQLATYFNETWNFHPWVPGGRSKHSQLHGLFGWAVTKQHEPLLSIALASGRDLERVCDLPLVGESLPALHVVSKLGYYDILTILLNVCNVNVLDHEGYTALHHAAGKGRIDICQLLSETKGIKMDVQSKSRCTPLLLAAKNGHGAVARLLLEKNVNIESQDDNGQTPIHWAATNGHEAVVKILVKERADIESKDNAGQTPLSRAAENGHGAVVKMLLERGANIDSEDHNAWIPLVWAARNGNEAVIELLLEKHPDINFTNNTGGNPLSRAAKLELEAVIPLLYKGFYHVPYPRNNGFVGRQPYLKSLLAVATPTESRKSDLTTICGLDGIGKTELALEVAYQIGGRKRDCSVFWARAGSYTQLEDDYRSIGMSIGVQHDSRFVIERVNHKLDIDPGKWLLVIDGANGTEDGSNTSWTLQRNFLPSRGSILVTTRNESIAINLRGSILRLDALSLQEGRELLVQQLKTSTVGNIDGVAPKMELVQLLGGHPLAIKLASQYMAQSQVTMSQYLQLWQLHGQRIIDILCQMPCRGDHNFQQGSDRIGAVSCLISLKAITANHPELIGCLKHIAFFPYTNIPVSLIMATEVVMDILISALLQYSLITLDVRSDYISVHRLVQLAMRAWLSGMHE